MVSVICPLGAIRMKALGTKSVGSAAACAASTGMRMLRRRPPPLARPAFNSVRRDRPLSVGPSSVAIARISAPAADCARPRGIDVGIGRMGIGRQQGGRRHDLAGLTVAALYDLAVEPGLLDFLPRGRIADRFDRRDGGFSNAVDRGDALPRA